MASPQANMFLDRMRKSDNLLCQHSDECFFVQFTADEDRCLTCRECNQTVSLRHLFSHLLSPQASLALAQEYVRWSGDDAIVCRVDTSEMLYNRVLISDVVTHYATVSKGCLLLKLLHAPFVKDSYRPTTEALSFLQETIEEQLDRFIQRAACDTVDQKVGIVAKNALIFLKNTVVTELEHYFSFLVPYVKEKRHLDERTKSVSLLFETFHAAEPDFLQRFLESNYIYRNFAKYCAAFDAVHVAALCFLCQDNLALVYDLALNFLGNVCCDRYEVVRTTFRIPDAKENRIRKVLMDAMSFSRNWVPVLEALWKGGPQLVDYFSEPFFKTIQHMEITAAMECDTSPDLRYYFPRVLFQDYSDYFALKVAYIYYSVEIRKQRRETHDAFKLELAQIITECKTLFKYIKSSITRMKALYECCLECILQTKTKKEKVRVWSTELVRRVLDCFPELEMEWNDVIPLVSKLVSENQHNYVKDAEESTLSKLEPFANWQQENWNSLMARSHEWFLEFEEEKNSE